jgi:mannobiose 2-epimerase
MSATKVLESECEGALLKYKTELRLELDEILTYWINNVVDEEKGGFYGAVSTDNVADLFAPKGVVLNSRILWTFSAASRFSENKHCLDIAKRAFNYIDNHFIDHEQGGVFWSVDHNGKILDGKKQVYGLAFCLYGLVEYYKVTGNEIALGLARDLFKCIEKYSFDKENKGYIEAFTKEWQPIDDLRLSEKDSNEKKTMNTHLHIIEAYANLYQVWPEIFLRERITGLLNVFEKYFLNNNHHLHLFMTEDWKVRSSILSFGHDVEASWLLYECAEISGNELYIDRYKKIALQLADAAAEALDTDGGMWYEYDPAIDYWIKEKHSWPQAEAMVGFFNVYQLSGNEKYLQLSLDSWQFVKKHIKDSKNGEWFWGVKEDYSIMQKDKAGFWKCPYHSGRACMEIIKRINSQPKYQG